MSTVLRIGLIAAGIALVAILLFKFVLPMLANQFGGLGIEIPGWLVNTFGIRMGFALFLGVACASILALFVGGVYVIRRLVR